MIEKMLFQNVRPEKNRREDDHISVRQGFFALVLKLSIMLILTYLFFTLVFGVTRYPDDSMFPAIKMGDVVLYSRLTKSYVASDVLALEYGGNVQTRRVIAVAGDTVDLTEDGLTINGHLQTEAQIYEETLPYVKGIEFPITVEKGYVFVLGDKRTIALDSRMYGPVKADDTLGKVMTILRRRNI